MLIGIVVASFVVGLLVGFKLGQFYTRNACADGLARMLAFRTDKDELMDKFVGKPPRSEAFEGENAGKPLLIS